MKYDKRTTEKIVDIILSLNYDAQPQKMQNMMKEMALMQEIADEGEGEYIDLAEFKMKYPAEMAMFGIR